LRVNAEFESDLRDGDGHESRRAHRLLVLLSPELGAMAVIDRLQELEVGRRPLHRDASPDDRGHAVKDVHPLGLGYKIRLQTAGERLNQAVPLTTTACTGSTRRPGR